MLGLQQEQSEQDHGYENHSDKPQDDWRNTPDPVLRPLPLQPVAVEDGRALLVSQFSPDAPWSTHGALTRNATIAALSRLVCVIEPGRTGGSIRTARHALEQGKTVMAYTRPEEESVMRELERSGARRLLGEDGGFTPARVTEAWEAKAPRPARQSEMF